MGPWKKRLEIVPILMRKNGITQNYGIKIVLYFNFSLTNQFVTFYSILILNGALKNKC